MSTIRVILADDHNLVRAGLRKLLESMPQVQVVGEAFDGLHAMSLVEQLKPDIVLMDIAMPGLNGLEVTARISKECPDVRVVILSMHQIEDYVRQALRQGAVGYLLKDCAPLELEQAIAAVSRGETYLSPAVSRDVVTDYVLRLRSEEDKRDGLTQRQREVLKLIAEGHSTKEIARKLDLAVKTVDTHRTLMMKQLDLHDVAGLVRYAMRTGLVT